MACAVAPASAGLSAASAASKASTWPGSVRAKLSRVETGSPGVAHAAFERGVGVQRRRRRVVGRDVPGDHRPQRRGVDGFVQPPVHAGGRARVAVVRAAGGGDPDDRRRARLRRRLRRRGWRGWRSSRPSPAGGSPSAPAGSGAGPSRADRRSGRPRPGRRSRRCRPRRGGGAVRRGTAGWSGRLRPPARRRRASRCPPGRAGTGLRPGATRLATGAAVSPFSRASMAWVSCRSQQGLARARVGPAPSGGVGQVTGVSSRCGVGSGSPPSGAAWHRASARTLVIRRSHASSGSTISNPSVRRRWISRGRLPRRGR